MAALIALERTIVDLSERHLEGSSYTPFASDQLTATHTALGALHDTKATVGDDIERFTQVLCEVLDVDIDVARKPNASVVRCMVETTPSVRSELVFGAGTPQSAHAGVSLERIPRLLLALCVLVELAREAGMRDVTFQTVMRLFSENLSLLIMLAHVDCEVAWRSTKLIDLPLTGGTDHQSRYVTILTALLPGAQRKANRTLGDVPCESLSADVVDQVTSIQLDRVRADMLRLNCADALVVDAVSTHILHDSFRSLTADAIDEEALLATPQVFSLTRGASLESRVESWLKSTALRWDDALPRESWVAPLLADVVPALSGSSVLPVQARGG